MSGAKEAARARSRRATSCHDRCEATGADDSTVMRLCFVAWWSCGRAAGREAQLALGEGLPSDLLDEAVEVGCEAGDGRRWAGGVVGVHAGVRAKPMAFVKPARSGLAAATRVEGAGLTNDEASQNRWQAHQPVR